MDGPKAVNPQANRALASRPALRTKTEKSGCTASSANKIDSVLLKPKVKGTEPRQTYCLKKSERPGWRWSSADKEKPKQQKPRGNSSKPEKVVSMAGREKMLPTRASPTIEQTNPRQADDCSETNKPR